VHAAPPVRVSLGRSWGWPLFIGAAVGAATGNMLAWALLHREIGAALPLALLGAVGAGVLTAWRVGRSQSSGDLYWDGTQWHWCGRPGKAQVVIDLGGWLLLRFEPTPAGSPQWIGLSRRRSSGPWAALRAALYSPRPADPLDVPPA
jgi:hypothetical protein